MKRILPNTAKVEQGGKGVGVPSAADIERRAKELAKISGRDVTDEDRRAAQAEFLDQTLPDSVNEDKESMRSSSRDPSDPPTNRGHQTPEYVDADEKTNLERLALEGVEEAQHDQMLSSRRKGASQPPRKRGPRP